MTFWNWRRGLAATAGQGTAALAISDELAPIELYTADSRVVGWIAPTGQRVTDLLNSQDELRLWRPSPGPLDGSLSEPMPDDPPPAAGASHGRNGAWESLESARVILAMPPEWRASRQLRLHRRLRRAALVAGPFSVTGNIHLPPGAEVEMQVLRGQRFVPLTDAYILHTGAPSFEHVVSVVIVNCAHIAQIVPLVSLA